MDLSTTNLSDSPATNLCQEVVQRLLKEYVIPLRPKGGKIPTNRALAAELGVNVGTVAKALYNLRSQGFIRSIVGSGTYVLPAEVRKNQFGVYYGANFLSPLPQDRVYSFLDREIHHQAVTSDIQIRQYLDTKYGKGLSPVLINEASLGLLDGLFVVTSTPQNREALLALGVPTVGYGESFSHGGVFLDRRDFASQAVELLMRRGRRRLALISCGPRINEYDRYFGVCTGFSEALARTDAPFFPEWLMDGPAVEMDIDHVQFGKEAFQQLWHAKSGHTPDGVVIATDALALGALQGAKELGIRIPDTVTFAVAENKESIWPELNCCERFQFCMSEVTERIFDILSAGRAASPVTLAVRARAV